MAEREARDQGRLARKHLRADGGGSSSGRLLVCDLARQGNRLGRAVVPLHACAEDLATLDPNLGKWLQGARGSCPHHRPPMVGLTAVQVTGREDRAASTTRSGGFPKETHS